MGLGFERPTAHNQQKLDQVALPGTKLTINVSNTAAEVRNDHSILPWSEDETYCKGFPNCRAPDYKSKIDKIGLAAYSLRRI